jgi:protein Mpv17
MGLLERKPLTGISEEFRKKFPAVYLFDWCIWPPTQYLNFMFVPAHLRVLYVNVVTVLWDVFLSYIKHYDQISHPGDV